VYDGPRARITFADKSHARFHFQRSIEPRYGMRSASFYFDLNDLRHAFSALNMPPPAKRVHISRLGTFRSAYMSHAALTATDRSGPISLAGERRASGTLTLGGAPAPFGWFHAFITTRNSAFVIQSVVMKYHIQQRTVDTQIMSNVVVDEAELPESFMKKLTRERVVPTISARVS
jgi:hypothetical protein